MASILSVLSLITAVAAQSGPAVPTKPPPTLPILIPINDLNLIVVTNVVILSFFIFFALLKLPRFFIRFSRKSEWALGHILRSVPWEGAGDHWKRNFSAASIPDKLYNATMETGSEDSHTWHSHSTLRPKRETQPQYPATRSRSCGYYIHRISAVLNRSAMPGYTVGRFLIVLGYCFIIMVASMYMSNPFIDYIRTGYIALGQIPIVFALASKNNILGMILALGYEKLNYLHRTVGQIIVLTSNIHAIGFFYKWSIEGTFIENIMQPNISSVLLSLAALNLLVIFSGSFWREKHYNVFMISHIAGFITFIVGLCSHTPVTIPWVVAALIVYAVDHVMRIVKSRISDATLRPLPDLGLTRIEIHRLNAGWRAGQHVRVRVISSGMGLWGWTEVHPFTIASVGGDGMLLMCKKAGGWTNKLFDMATSNPIEKGATARNIKVILEGPYGGIGHTLMDTFSGALFVAGGSGITFALASIQELIQKDMNGKSKVKVIDLVWCVQSPGSVMSMLPTFDALVQQAPLTSVRVSVHYTRASPGDDPNKLYGYLPSNIVLTPGRPRFPNVLNEVIDHTCAMAPVRSGLFVGVCGPTSLGEQVRQAVGQIDDGPRGAVGGVELCEEIFGW